MRKPISVVIFLLAFAAVSFAQGAGADRRPEIFVGYSNLQAEGVPERDANSNNSFSDAVFGERSGLHGVEASVTGYLTPRFGVTGDFSFNQRSRNFAGAAAGTTGDVDTRVFQFMAGPHARFPNQTRVTPFLHALFGVANTRFEVEQRQQVSTGTTTQSFNTSATDFAMALGGGIDVRANNRVAVRALQLDYNPVFLRDRSINVLGAAGALQTQRIESNRQDNIRLSFGVVFK
jgi:opacity protein-like surface antigen